MSRPLITALSLACILILTAFQPYAPPEPEPPDTVTDRAWQATAQNNSVDVVVTALGYPDLSPARALATKEAKTKFVTDALIAHANLAQASLRAELAARGLRYLPLWISNQILVRDATRADVLWLGNRADVANVDVDAQVKGIETFAEVDRLQSNPFNRKSAIQNPKSIEWGVQRVNAPQVWAMGYWGQGIVVANLDTGVRWDHDALKLHYRGWNGSTADHNYNWFDPTAFAAAPVDDNGHGTHTTGTAIGDDGAGNQIGVAPGAQWIACRNMAGASGIGSVALYTACFQFALAPTDVAGNNPDPAKGADITSNSWGCDPAFGEVGCDVPTALITVTQALRDAGVMVVASAGNKGNACRSVINAPGMLDQAFTIGATAGDSGNTIAGFSSRGPSSLTGKVKPDVVAPGVDVRSAQRSAANAYGYLDGTSMAAPHVAGVAALMWSAAPWLRGDVGTTEAILRASAKPLTDSATCFGTSGSARPNNTYGYGLIDARAAMTLALAIVPVTSAPLQAEQNAPITFTLTARNAMSLTLQNVTITSTLPASAALISSSPPGALNSDAISWQFAGLAPGESLNASFVVTASGPGAITNGGVLLSADGLATTVPGKPASTLVIGPRTPRAYLPLMTHTHK